MMLPRLANKIWHTGSCYLTFDINGQRDRCFELTSQNFRESSFVPCKLWDVFSNLIWTVASFQLGVGDWKHLVQHFRVWSQQLRTIAVLDLQHKKSSVDIFLRCLWKCLDTGKQCYVEKFPEEFLQCFNFLGVDVVYCMRDTSFDPFDFFVSR